MPLKSIYQSVIKDFYDIFFSFAGKDGRPVHIDVHSLTNEEKNEFHLGWKNNQFNQFASDRIPLNRNVGDVRDPE